MDVSFTSNVKKKTDECVARCVTVVQSVKLRNQEVTPGFKFSDRLCEVVKGKAD